MTWVVLWALLKVDLALVHLQLLGTSSGSHDLSKLLFPLIFFFFCLFAFLANLNFSSVLAFVKPSGLFLNFFSCRLSLLHLLHAACLPWSSATSSLLSQAALLTRLLVFLSSRLLYSGGLEPNSIPSP